MKFTGAAVLATLATSAAFVAPSATVAPRSAVVMSAASDIRAAAPKALAAASAALLSAAPAFATEGTSQALGIDNALNLYLPLGTILFVNVLFFQWAKSQPEGEFFGDYDQRRK